MFRKQPHVAGILFESSGSIQTRFIKFELDIVFLTDKNSVCKIQRNVKPWRIIFSAVKPKRILEVSAGRFKCQTGSPSSTLGGAGACSNNSKPAVIKTWTQ
ncbi:MAG: DUF192 domain-containing protein [Bdellovibrio sp.]|nr:DUF192 domain-containing protein [Bdellovibrio sp.]